MPTIDANNNIVVTATDFRAVFPEFANVTAYPDAQINAHIALAGCYISTQNYGDLDFNARAYAIELMAAHLLTLDLKASAGTSGGGVASAAGGQVISASIDGVSVSMTVPPNKDQLQYWLNQTPYGQRYLAILQSRITPLYLWGSRERLLN